MTDKLVKRGMHQANEQGRSPHQQVYAMTRKQSMDAGDRTTAAAPDPVQHPRDSGRNMRST